MKGAQQCTSKVVVGSMYNQVVVHARSWESLSKAHLK